MSWANGDRLTPANLNAKSSLVFHVKDATYGAVGDGTTNDTAAIQAAISAASNAGGGIVRFSEGTYKVVSPSGGSALVITNPGVQLEGISRKFTTITDTTGAGTTVWVSPSAAGGFVMRDLRIIGGAKAIVCTNAQEMLFENVWVSSSAAKGWEMDTCVDVLWVKCHTTGGVATNAVGVVGSGECNAWRMLGCRFSGNSVANTAGVNYDLGTSLLMGGCTVEGYTTGVRLASNATVQSAVINGCYFELYKDYGVYAGDSPVLGLTVVGSYFNGGDASDTGIASKASGACIVGNRFINNAVDIQTVAGGGDHFIGPNYTTNSGTAYVTDGGARTTLFDESGRWSTSSQAPTSGTASGRAGATTWGYASGTTWFYVCTSANSWHRAALNPF